LKISVTNGAGFIGAPLCWHPAFNGDVPGRCDRINLAVVQAICDILECTKPRGRQRSYRDLICFVNDEPCHDRRYATNTLKIEIDRRWGSRGNFKTGLTQKIAWRLDNDGWGRPIGESQYAGTTLDRLATLQ
jgi:dTDP-glucose 4,6-dehydratase